MVRAAAGTDKKLGSRNYRWGVYQHWLHADTLPMFRAMDAALAREVAS